MKVTFISLWAISPALLPHPGSSIKIRESWPGGPVFRWSPLDINCWGLFQCQLTVQAPVIWGTLTRLPPPRPNKPSLGRPMGGTSTQNRTIHRGIFPLVGVWLLWDTLPGWFSQEGGAPRSGPLTPEGYFGPAVSQSESESVSRSALSDSLLPHGLLPTRLLCSWDSPGKNTRVGSHSLF